jgi:uncharacterized Zn finger protein
MKRRHGVARWVDVSYSYMYGFAPYVSVASRQAQATRRLAQLRKKGRPVAPVVIHGRKIATTFWGASWCHNLERYGDFANRLPRGRSYVRNGSVVDLQIEPGVVTALVSGSDLYDVLVAVGALPTPRWRAVCRDVSGAIDSVIELLQGRLSEHVMTRLCADGTGLFPSPREIEFNCSCPDAAYMCKHVAAVLYGVGARLDREPGLLFTLRQVKEGDLVGDVGARAAASLVSGRDGDGVPGSRRIVDESSLSAVFGIDVAIGQPAETPPATVPPAPPGATRARTKTSSAPKTGGRRPAKAKRLPSARNPVQRLTPRNASGCARRGQPGDGRSRRTEGRRRPPVPERVLPPANHAVDATRGTVPGDLRRGAMKLRDELTAAPFATRAPPAPDVGGQDVLWLVVRHPRDDRREGHRQRERRSGQIGQVVVLAQVMTQIDDVGVRTRRRHVDQWW